MTLTDAQDQARLALVKMLRARDYRFVTATPATQARILRRPDRQVGQDLRDVFGWSLPFAEDALDRDLVEQMRCADVLVRDGDGFRSAVRVSSLDDLLFMHDAYPTDDPDAVFFGPDSYRFANFIRAELELSGQSGTIVDVGAGAGVGALAAAELRPEATLLLTDVNERALRFARINAAAAGREVRTVHTDGLEGIGPTIDIALANPPYIIDPAGRAYRDGGAMHGGQLSLDLATAALKRLRPGGRLLLYTGAAIVAGRNELQDALTRLAAEADCRLACCELDPDVFGEELEQPGYADVERIAVIGAVMTRI